MVRQEVESRDIVLLFHNNSLLWEVTHSASPVCHIRPVLQWSNHGPIDPALKGSSPNTATLGTKLLTDELWGANSTHDQTIEITDIDKYVQGVFLHYFSTSKSVLNNFILHYYYY
jgi:hypothetical protein